MADFKIKVIVDPSGARRGAQVVRKELNQTRRVASGLGSELKRFFAFAAITAGVAAGVRILANFEQQMSTVKAVTGATEKQFKQLRDEAKRLGKTTRFSASQAAEGLVFLARAGFSAEQATAALSSTLTLAQAGALDLGSAADIATNVLAGFGLEVADLGEVVDVLAFTANNSNTNVRQLGDAIKFVAPVAAGFGVTVQETAAAIGTLSDAGLQASLAGTGLRAALIELEAPSEATRAVFEDLKISAFDARPSIVGLSGAFDALSNAGLSSTQAIEIAGKRGGPALIQLVANNEKVKELGVELQDVAGFAQEVSTVMDDNLNGAMLAVKSSIEAVVIALGDMGVTALLTTLFQGLATVLRGVASAIDFLAPVLRTAAYLMGTVLALNALPLMSAGLALVTVGIRALTVVILANPIGALIFAVITIIDYFDGWALAMEGVKWLIEQIGIIGSKVLKSIVKFLAPVIAKVKELWEWLRKVLVAFGLMDKAAAKTGSALTKMGKKAADAIDPIPGAAQDAAEDIDWMKQKTNLSEEEFKSLGVTSSRVTSSISSGFQAAAAATSAATGAVRQLTASYSALGSAAAGAAASTAAAISGGGGAGDSGAGFGVTGNFAAGDGSTAGGGGSFSFGTDDRLTEQLGDLASFYDVGQDINTSISTFGGGGLTVTATPTKALSPTTLRLYGKGIALAQAALGQGYGSTPIGGVLKNVAGQEWGRAVDRLNANGELVGPTGQVLADAFGLLSANLPELRKQNATNNANVTGNGIYAYKGLTAIPPIEDLFPPAAAPDFGPNTTTLPGFQTGGRFTVGGAGGPDSQLVQFRGSPGEEVTIDKPGRRRGGGGGSRGITINANFTITSPDAEGLLRNTGRIKADMIKAIREAMEQAGNVI